MDKRVIIIHPSLLIREGLNAVVKNSFMLDSIQLSGPANLIDYQEIKDHDLILLVDATVDHQKDFVRTIEFLKNHNTVKIILIRDVSDSKECEDNCTCCFYTDVQKDRLEWILKAHIENKQQTSKLKKDNSDLTEREIEVVKQIAYGKTNKDIAEALFISIHTVISHRKNITEKLGIKSISGLTVYAILNNLIDTNSIDPESLI